MAVEFLTDEQAARYGPSHAGEIQEAGDRRDFDDDGRLHFTALEPEPEPASVLDLRTAVNAMLPEVETCRVDVAPRGRKTPERDHPGALGGGPRGAEAAGAGRIEPHVPDRTAAESRSVRPSMAGMTNAEARWMSSVKGNARRALHHPPHHPWTGCLICGSASGPDARPWLALLRSCCRHVRGVGLVLARTSWAGGA